MEWVNITAKTLPEAIDLALSNLGVDEAEAEIDVLEEPRQGLFGRPKGNARVRARVKPKETRPKEGRARNKRRRGGEGGERDGSQKDGRKRSRQSGDGREPNKESAKAGGRDETQKPSSTDDDGRNKGGAGRGRGGDQKQRRGEEHAVEASVEEVAEHVEGFLAGLVEALGLDGGVRIDTDTDDGIIGVVEGKHGLLVGPKGRTLEAVQELARVTAQRSVPSNVRIKVDVGGYREQRNAALQQFAEKVAAEARADGKERSLEPMNSADRKVVHDALNGVEGIETRSAGTDPNRRVVVVPLGAGPEDSGDVADDVDEVPTDGEASEPADAVLD